MKRASTGFRFGYPSVSLYDDDTTAHWEVGGGGRRSFEVSIFGKYASCLSIEATEYGRKSSKRIMLELDEKEAAALVEFIRENYLHPENQRHSER